MDELERRIEALSAALERGELEQAAQEFERGELLELVKQAGNSQKARTLIERALEVAERVRAARESELRRIAEAGRARSNARDAQRARIDFTHRLAGPEDRALVVVLMSELFDEVAAGPVAEESKRLVGPDVEAALGDPAVRIYLAELEGAPVGLLRVDISTRLPNFRLRKDPRCGYVDQMFLRPAYRKRGVGLRLLKLAEDWLREQGVTHCMLHAAPHALGFYSAHGYQTTRELFRKL